MKLPQNHAVYLYHYLAHPSAIIPYGEVIFHMALEKNVSKVCKYIFSVKNKIEVRQGEKIKVH